MISPLTVTVPYDDYCKLLTDSADKAATIALIKADFPDDSCRVVALKSVLGIEDPVEGEPEPTPDEPEDPEEEPGTTPDPDETE